MNRLTAFSVPTMTKTQDILARINQGDQAPMRSPRAEMVASILGDLGANNAIVAYCANGVYPAVGVETNVPARTIDALWAAHSNEMLHQITTATLREGN